MLTTRALTPKPFSFSRACHAKTNLRAGTDQDHIRRTAFGFREHIGASCHTGIFRLAAVKMRHSLPREH